METFVFKGAAFPALPQRLLPVVGIRLQFEEEIPDQKERIIANLFEYRMVLDMDEVVAVEQSLYYRGMFDGQERYGLVTDVLEVTYRSGTRLLIKGEMTAMIDLWQSYLEAKARAHLLGFRN